MLEMMSLQQVSTSPMTSQGLTLGSQVLIIVSLLLGSVILLMASGHISGKLMESARRSYWLGFALGFLFVGIGALVSIVVYFASRKQRRRRAPAGRPLPQNSSSGNVEYEQSPLELGPLLLAPIEQPQDLFAQGADVCPACNSPVPIFMDSCWNCGTMIHEEFIQTN
jgi:hypothetical protein